MPRNRLTEKKRNGAVDRRPSLDETAGFSDEQLLVYRWDVVSPLAQLLSELG